MALRRIRSGQAVNGPPSRRLRRASGETGRSAKSKLNIRAGEENRNEGILGANYEPKAAERWVNRVSAVRPKRSMTVDWT
jgi:hypothetical protein